MQREGSWISASTGASRHARQQSSCSSPGRRLWRKPIGTSNADLAGDAAPSWPFSFLVVWLGGERLLVQPMRSLIDSAEEIGGGDMSARVATEGMAKDSRILGTAFNRMAAELARHEAELQAANRRNCANWPRPMD